MLLAFDEISFKSSSFLVKMESPSKHKTKIPDKKNNINSEVIIFSKYKDADELIVNEGKDLSDLNNIKDLIGVVNGEN